MYKFWKLGKRRTTAFFLINYLILKRQFSLINYI